MAITGLTPEQQAEYDAEQAANATALERAQAGTARLQELERLETERLATAELTGITESLKSDELAEAGLNPHGISRFANEHRDALKGLKGDKLLTKVKALRDKTKGDDRNLFFSDTEVSTSESLQKTLNGDKKPVQQY